MITPKGLHYRRQHTPVPVVDEAVYRMKVGLQGQDLKSFAMADLRCFEEQELAVTLMCTGNRRSEFNNDRDGETMGLPWKNGSISTARWGGYSLAAVLRAVGIDEAVEEDGYHFLSMWGVEGYHVSVPLHKVFQRHGDCLLAYRMNG